MAGGRQRVPLSVRFWRHVKKGLPGECWPWTAATDKDGYGTIRDDDHRTVRSHRAAWAMANGVPVPSPDILILHRCDNPPCCNEAHLFDGSHASNIADKVAKGRQARGERIGRAKITRAQAEEIRTRYATGTMTLKEAAEPFGVTKHTAHLIVKGRIWRSVKGTNEAGNGR